MRNFRLIIQYLFENGQLGSPTLNNDDYKGEHEAPDKSNGAPFHNVEGIYPADFYSSQGRQFYATEDGAGEIYAMVRDSFKKPLKKILVYRAVPKGNIKDIMPGNWISPSKKYAQDHGKENLNNTYKIISKLVNAQDLFTDGNSLLEWGYDPQPINADDSLIRSIRGTLSRFTRMINGEKIIAVNKAEGDKYFGKTPEELIALRNIFVNNYKDIIDREGL